MTLAEINLTLIEFIVLPLVAIIFVSTLYFFIKSRKSLREAIKATKKAALITEIKKEKPTPAKQTSVVELGEQLARMRYETSMPKQDKIESVVTKKSTHKEEIAVQDLKNTIAQQQRMLDSYLQKMEELENEGRDELNGKIEELEKKLDELHGEIEEKDDEIKELHQEVSAGNKMATRIDEIYKEFELLQSKMTVLEKQAGRANNLAIELEDTKYTYEQVHKELLRKQEKLEELMEENQLLRHQKNEAEDKLADANLQRQQLHKKVHFLTDLNSDMQSIADTNKKLQTDLRRIGELESMLNMMSEEREFLLRKKMDK
jgi:chromosome segregation ATPase